MPGGAVRDSDVAYSRLRERVLDLRLPPGAVVNEQSLAAELAMGRTPVHEAVARLASDGFLTVLPRRGTTVTPLTLKSVLEIFEAREAIECGIAYAAASRATPESIARLEKLVAEADLARDGGDTDEYLRSDLEIHLFLVRLIDNSLLEDAAERLLLHNLRFWRFYFASNSHPSTTMLSHLELVEALRSNDPEAAQRIMREHITASRGMLRMLF